jgi:hypothetical protein
VVQRFKYISTLEAVLSEHGQHEPTVATANKEIYYNLHVQRFDGGLKGGRDGGIYKRTNTISTLYISSLV